MQNGNSTNGSDQQSTNGAVRIGFFICHCGVNISSIVNVVEVRDYIATLPNVIVSTEHLIKNINGFIYPRFHV